MNILGISAFYHDSAAALVMDGRIVAGAQEERFTRKKHDSRYPTNAIEYCLREGGIDASKLDHVAFYEKPFIKFERLMETYLAFAPIGFRSFHKALPVWLQEKLFQKNLIAKQLRALAPGIDWNSKLLFAEHHQSHAASAFFPSPYEEAAVLTMDGVGEWATASTAIGSHNGLSMQKEIHFPHSLGLLYSAFTYYCGFRVNSGEYKLMGLAPYGTPIYRQKILDNLIDIKQDGSFRLNLRYFNYCTGLTMTSRHFDQLFGGPARTPEDPITQKHIDLAASVQSVLEEVVLRIARALRKESGMTNLCLAGGVALNCVANGKLLKENIFENIWVQPAAGDAGGALGAALAAYYQFKQFPRTPSASALQYSYLGPSYSNVDIEKQLTAAGAVYETIIEPALLEKTAAALAAGKVIGWFQGRMEFGPRALGNRSILGDARQPNMQKTMNLKIKFRESFRPFAPSVLREEAEKWFDIKTDSPYMLFTADLLPKHRLPLTREQHSLFGIEKLNVPRSTIPAVTHVDYSARLQTVTPESNPRYHALLSEFFRQTGCPILINTSFNIRGEPIVCTPEEAFRCFMGCGMDILVIGDCWLEKPSQNTASLHDYRAHHAPD